MRGSVQRLQRDARTQSNEKYDLTHIQRERKRRPGRLGTPNSNKHKSNKAQARQQGKRELQRESAAINDNSILRSPFARRSRPIKEMNKISGCMQHVIRLLQPLNPRLQPLKRRAMGVGRPSVATGLAFPMETLTMKTN